MIVHVLRKPLTGTVAQNALQHGCGALNIDECRVTTSDTSEQYGERVTISRGKIAEGYDRPNRTMHRTDKPKERSGPAAPLGRWPANLVHDGSDEVIAIFPEAGNGWKKNYGAEVYAIENRQYGGGSFGGDGFLGGSTYGDSGSAARFFQQVTIK